MENYKSEIVTVEVFIQNRPDMEIHSPKSITTAILTAATLLNSECNNLINDVWEFNRLQPANPENELFRSDYELSQIKEAIISQTQYNLNMGNDFAIGGGSYSIGNVNASYNRPENRPALAPGVLKLLQNARVYVLTDFGNLFNKGTKKECVNPAVAQKDWVDAKFLEKHHPSAKVGNVAYIDNQHNVNFGNPQDLDITTYRTKLIAGGRGNHQDFYKIDEVPNIAFFGNDDFGTYSALQRGELKQMGINPADLKKVWDPINGVYKFINDFDISYWNGITKEQAYFAIYASGTVWRIDGIYRLGWITQKVNALNELRWYESLIDNNVGLDPVTNPQAWKELANQAVDLNQIIDQLKPYIDQVVDGRIDNALDQRKHQFVQETQGQILTFKDQADYEAFRDTNNLVDLDFEDVPDPVQPLPNNIAYIDRNNTFTGNNIFNRPLNIVEAQNNNQAVTKNYADQIKNIATNKQDRIRAGNGISISNNTITNTLYGKTLKIVEKHTEIYKQTFSLNSGKPQRRKLFTWSPKNGTANAQGYLFYIRLEGRNNNAVNSSIQFRQTHLNDADFYNIVKMPINDGVGGSYAGNGYVTTADFIPFLISDGDVWILDSNADIFGGTLKFIIYEISQEVELR